MYIHSEDVSDVTYVMDRARVRVKAIGALTASDVQMLSKIEPMETSERVASEEPTADMSEVKEC